MMSNKQMQIEHRLMEVHFDTCICERSGGLETC